MHGIQSSLSTNIKQKNYSWEKSKKKVDHKIVKSKNWMRDKEESLSGRKKEKSDVKVAAPPSFSKLLQASPPRLFQSKDLPNCQPPPNGICAQNDKLCATKWQEIVYYVDENLMPQMPLMVEREKKRDFFPSIIFSFRLHRDDKCWNWTILEQISKRLQHSKKIGKDITEK